MRLLIALSVLQTACLVALLAVVIDGPVPMPVSPQDAPSPAFRGWSQGVAPAPLSTATVDEARLRDVIRAELAAARDTGASVAARSPRLDPEEAERRRRQAADLISRYRGAGEVSRQQMAELDRAIAALDPADRGAALSELVRAINAQEIRARF